MKLLLKQLRIKIAYMILFQFFFNTKIKNI